MFLIFHLIFIIHLKKKNPFNSHFFSQLTKALHYSITFDPTSCVFQELNTNDSGHENNGLYSSFPEETAGPKWREWVTISNF